MKEWLLFHTVVQSAAKDLPWKIILFPAEVLRCALDDNREDWPLFAKDLSAVPQDDGHVLSW